MTFSNIHGQCGYFSKDKTNSSLQLFYNMDKRYARRCCDGEENVHRKEGNSWLMQLNYQRGG